MSTPVPIFELTVPLKSAPGFLRRQRKATIFMRKLKNINEDPDESIFDDMIDFLLPFITKPTDRGEARETMWDMSEEQFEQLLEGVSGLGEAVEEEIAPSQNGGS